MYVCICMCVYACVRTRSRMCVCVYTHIHKHIHVVCVFFYLNYLNRNSVSTESFWPNAQQYQGVLPPNFVKFNKLALSLV